MVGHPSIVLGMCRDYWDGSAISNLPATLRKSVLDMHQQWSLVSNATVHGSAKSQTYCHECFSVFWCCWEQSKQGMATLKPRSRQISKSQGCVRLQGSEGARNNIHSCKLDPARATHCCSERLCLFSLSTQASPHLLTASSSAR